MKQVNVHDAKSQLSKLLEEVEAGERVVIAREGEPVAVLSPLSGRGPEASARPLPRRSGDLTEISSPSRTFMLGVVYQSSAEPWDVRFDNVACDVMP